MSENECTDARVSADNECTCALGLCNLHSQLNNKEVKNGNNKDKQC